MALFRLAWSAKLQIPVLITVVFMACDIRLQLEINIFWEPNNRQQTHASRNGSQRRASREDMRRAALVAAALYQQQRRRLIQEMRSQQAQERENALPLNAPLATGEDSDLDGSQENLSETGTITCSHRSTTSEAGSFASYSDSDDDKESTVTAGRRKRRIKRSRVSSPETDDDDEDEEDETISSEDDDEEDDDNDPGTNGGASSQGGGGYRDHERYDDEDDSDDMDDSSNTGGDGYESPLILEIELRHRPLHADCNKGPSHDTASQKPTHKVVLSKELQLFRNLVPSNTVPFILPQKILML